MEIHIHAHKTTAPCSGIWQKQSLDRVSDCISFLCTKQQTAPVPMWQMPCPTPILLRRAHCKGVIAAVLLFNTDTAFNQRFYTNNRKHGYKTIFFLGEHCIFREVYLFFQNTGAACMSLPMYVDVRQCMGMFQAYGLPILYLSKKWHCPWRNQIQHKA